MAAVTRDSAQQYHVRFAELVGRGFARFRRSDPVQVDPFLIGRAIAEVMRACSIRAASGRQLLWNEYRVILSRVDYEALRALQSLLDKDLRELLAREAGERGAELVGALRVTLVADDAGELEAGHAVIRPAFVPTERLAVPGAGEMTVQMDAVAVTGEIRPRADLAMSDQTVYVVDAPQAVGADYLLRWPSGEAVVPSGATVVIGRPHADPPANFVALAGASPRISKQHLILTTGAAGAKLARPPSANPVLANGQALAAGWEIELVPPVEISLSRGELVLVLTRM